MFEFFGGLLAPQFHSLGRIRLLRYGCGVFSFYGLHLFWRAEGCQTPKNDGQQNDDLAHIADEDLAFFEHSDADILPARRAVDRQFHQEESALLRLDNEVHDPGYYKRHKEAQQVKTHKHQALHVEDAEDLFIGNDEGYENGVYG